MALRPAYPVAACSTQNSSTTLRVCNSRLVSWCAPGSRPNHWQSSACDSQVNGCHSPTANVVKAHFTVSHVRPAWTWSFSVT